MGFPLALVLACTGPTASEGDTEPQVDSGEPGDTAVDTSVDTAAPDTLDCTTRSLKTVSLVLRAEWTAPAGAASYVEFGETAPLGQRTPVTTDEAVVLDLVGNGPEREIFWRGVSEVGVETFSCSGSTWTGAVPDNLPVLEVVLDDRAAEAVAPYVFGAFFDPNSSQSTLAAYRRDGTPVWYFQGSGDGTGLDVHGAGGLIVYNSFPTGELGGTDVLLHGVTLGGEPMWTLATPYAHHMFAPMPEGGFVLQRLDTRDYVNPRTGLSELWVGDRLTELAPDGTLTDVFSTWDALPPRENADMDVWKLYDGRDWTHGNMVRYDPSADTFLLSLAHAGDVLTVRRTDGAVVGLWGDDGADVTPPLNHNHDPGWLDDGHLLVFNTEDGDAGPIEYAPDGDGLSETWRCAFAAAPHALGEAERLENGNTFVSYGTRNRLVELTPDCEVVWEIDLDGQLAGAVFGQFHLVSDLYAGP